MYRVTAINVSRIWIEWAEWAESLCTANSPFPGHVIAVTRYFVIAVAYHSCLSLPAAFSQPGRSLLVELCSLRRRYMRNQILSPFSAAAFSWRDQNALELAYNFTWHVFRHYRYRDNDNMLLICMSFSLSDVFSGSDIPWTIIRGCIVPRQPGALWNKRYLTLISWTGLINHKWCKMHVEWPLCVS